MPTVSVNRTAFLAALEEPGMSMYGFNNTVGPGMAGRPSLREM
jgi:hypothetical protein